MSGPGHSLPVVTFPVTTHPTESPESPVPDEPRRRHALSPSRANDFRQCPLLYRYRAIDRLPERKTRAQVRGTLVHAVLEDLHGLPGPDRTQAAAAALVEPAWQRQLELTPDVTDAVPAAGTDAFLAEARQIVDAYFRLEDPASVDSESRELRLETELPGGVPVRGFVDRIDATPTGGIRVVDYKTGRAPRPGAEQGALFQMKFYALMLARSRGIVPEELRLLYLADGETLTYTPDGDELDRFGRLLGALWQAVLAAAESGEFEPSPGRMCRFCDHRERCPAFGGTPPPYPGLPRADAGEAGSAGVEE